MARACPAASPAPSTLCNEIETHHRLFDVEHAVAMTRKRSGTQFDPDLVEAFTADPTSILDTVARPRLWDDLIAADPGTAHLLTEAELVNAAHVIGYFTDLKSSHLAGHSERTVQLAAAAAEHAKLDAAATITVTLAASMHDLGRVAISSAIWDKPERLTDSEWEQVRLHAYHSERILVRIPGLAAAARCAGLHHERLDGSGYHRQCAGRDQPFTARLVGAADAYAAMLQSRPHRDALTPSQAGDELRAMAEGHALDPAAVNAVLAAAGDTRRSVKHSWPAGLTDREVDVLRQIALGRSIGEAAAELHLAPKTVDFHLQNIYSKAQVTTRAGATLFAMENDLLMS